MRGGTVLVERHLDFYADKFRLADATPGGRRTLIWQELIKA